jgi:hypothetical protein
LKQKQKNKEKKMNKIEKYIAENKLDGKKIADVLRDWDRGYKNLGEICQFWRYKTDMAVAHLKQAGLIAQ